MRMRADEARQFVVDNVAVRRQHLVLMKALLLEHYNDNPTVMLEAAVQRLGPSKPPNVVLHPTVDPAPVLRQLAEWISWWIAGCEALWGLVHSNVLLTVAAGVNTFHPGIEWTTIVPGSGGERAGWDFPEFKISYPNWLTRSRASTVPQVLCDPDLFLHELNIPGLHSEVEDALRESVFCFRAELYTAAVVMLGKAFKELLPQPFQFSQLRSRFSFDGHQFVASFRSLPSELRFESFLALGVALFPNRRVVFDLLLHHRVEDDRDLVGGRCGGLRGVHFALHPAEIVPQLRLVVMQRICRQSE